LAVGDLDAATTVSATAIEDLSVADASAGTSTVFTAGGLASFTGTVAAPAITVSSSDINIADGAAIGVNGITDLITFNAVSDGSPVIIGDGAAAPGQYQLSEDGDITASSVVFNAGSADVWLLNLGIEGSQTSDGGVAAVTLNTDSSVLVKGEVNFINAATNDSLTINAGDTIQVITDTGGIAMTDANGDLAGTLELTAHDIWVADQATIDQIAADPTFANAEALLVVNNGPAKPEGNIQVGELAVTMLGSSFLVQNTGTANDLSGLSVGEGGLSIVNNGSDPATVIIYGRQQAADGSIVTGEAFLEDVQFAGTGGFSDNSTVNGCEVGGCESTPPEPPVPPEDIPGAESILGPIGLMDTPMNLADNTTDSSDEGTEEEGDEEGEGGDSGYDGSLGLINTSPLRIEVPIDEPVTSGSDGPMGN
jgi:hypothetical protein